MKESRKHISVLDGVRGIAISMVMVFHFFQFRGVPPGIGMYLIAKIAHAGQTGVDLFFVLSGFLITGILLDSKNHPYCLRNFYIRRTLRIFPLYYGTLLFLYILIPLAKGAPLTPWSSQWWFWSYSQDVGLTFLKTPPIGPGHFWSLAVEEHFYLLWPFLVFRYDSHRLRSILGWIIAATIPIRALLIVAGYGVFFFTLCRIDALAAGALLAVLIRDPSAWNTLIVWLRRLMPFYVPLLGGLYIVFSQSRYAALEIFKYTGIALLYFAFIALAMAAREGGWPARLLSGKWLTTLGKYSYSMYVFHPFIYSYMNSKILLSPGVAFVSECLATFLAALGSWYLWENPFLKLKDHFPS